MAPNKHPLSVLEWQQIGAMAGHGFLQFLGRKLKSDTLKIYTKAELQSVSLLLFGTILAVGYTRPVAGGQFRFPV